MRPLISLERRAGARYSVERLAKIQAAIGTPLRHCLVTEISDGGVRFNGFGCDIPDEFVLLQSGDRPAQDGRYKVIWRNGTIVGAKLIRDASPWAQDDAS